MEVFMYEQIYKKIEEECTFRNLSKGTEKQYIYHASCLLKWLGDKPVDEITLNDIKEYFLNYLFMMSVITFWNAGTMVPHPVTAIL